MNRTHPFLFDEAIAAFRNRGGRVIVEIGAIRNRASQHSDGHSTLRWPADIVVWSVDNDPVAVGLTRELTADRPCVLCVLADAIVFLQAYPGPIDLLYLDGPDPDREDRRRWHFHAYQAAVMRRHAVLLIDDTNLPHGGKGEFVIPAAIDDGFQLATRDRQTLLVR